MAFDFDDLEELLPAEVPEVVPLSDEDFAQFGKRLRAAEESEDYKDFGAAISEALWDGRAVQARITQVVRDLVDLLLEVVGSASPRQEPSCSALVHVLFRLSLSLSRDAVAALPGKRRDAVALLLGPAGSHLDDLAPQVGFYQSKGLTTVSAVWCVYPAALQHYQEVQLARELQDQLRGGGKLLVHLCGGHGHAAWCNIADLWHRGAKPFDGLPPLQDCLRAVVWECGPRADASLATLVPKPGKGTQKPRLTLEDARRMQRELYARFSSDDFQDQLEKLEKDNQRGSPAFIAERNRLLLDVQGPIIEAYGFEPSQRGVLDMLKAAAQWNSDEDYCRNRDHLNSLIGLGEECSSERRRRVEAAREEWAELQKRRQDAPQPEPTQASAVDYSGDETGMAVEVDMCLRRLLGRYHPEVDLTQLVRRHALVREAVIDACHYGAFWLGDDYGAKTESGRPLQGEFATWAAIDAAIEPPVPRLFLYSKRDAIIPAEGVERCIRAVRRYLPDADVQAEVCAEGAHMRLWDAQQYQCTRSLTAILRKGNLLES